MKLRTAGAALILATLALPGLAVAQDRPPEQGPRGPHGMFDRLDANGDGRVTWDEVQAARAAAVAGLDANGDGYLSKEEIVNFRLALAKQRIERQVDELFDRRDANGDGRLGADELLASGGFGEGGGMQMTRRLFDRIDTDGDGVVTREEADAARTRMQERMAQRGPKGPHAWGKGEGRHPMPQPPARPEPDAN
ncbi:EF-hand domain-containing protein [Haematobacter missouriensis]|nr:EF-hand domain-containing protein [Haematobacter missouriensis]